MMAAISCQGCMIFTSFDHVQFAAERLWLLKLLCVGLRSESDLQMYEQLNVLKIVMAYVQCSLCSPSEQVMYWFTSVSL